MERSTRMSHNSLGGHTEYNFMTDLVKRIKSLRPRHI